MNHRRALAGALALGLVLTAAGCGSSPDRSASSSDSASGAVQELAVTIAGKTVTPTNKRLKVALGTPLTITLTSDVAGELHVHSSPEQEIAFPKGRSTHQVTFTVPGVVEVEDHATDTLIAQLEVR